MGIVRTTLVLEDKFTSVLNNVNKAINDIGKSENVVNQTFQNTERQINNVDKALKSVDGSKMKSLKNQTKDANDELKKTDEFAESISRKMTKISKALFGVMGAKKAMETMDTITSARNKFNVLNGGNEAETQKTLDKIYTASQQSRSGYGDAISNVGKLMTNAGKAFDNNIDAAIKFNKIMAESYTIGGASAAEQASSMYQLIQALGSGTLQGDELRSVREGAQVAYQYIEKYAQGIYHTTDALKDMASQGKITSDIVTNAILQSADEIEAKFKTTQMTFAQMWIMIKNSAIKAFEDVSKRMATAMNGERVQKLMDGITKAIFFLGELLSNVLVIVSEVSAFFSDNWSFIAPIVWGLVPAFLALATAIKAEALANQFAAIMESEHLATMLPIMWWLFVFTAAIVGVIELYKYFADGLDRASQSAEAFGNAMLVVGGILALVGVIILIVSGVALALPLLVIGGLLLVLGAFMKWGGQITGVVYAIGAFFKNVFYDIMYIVLMVVNYISNQWMNFAEFFVNVMHNPVGAVVKLFTNMATTILGIISRIAQAIDNVFGTNLAVGVQGFMSKIDSWGDKIAEKYGDYQKLERSNLTPESLGINRWDYGDAYSLGKYHGELAKSWIAEKLDFSVKDKFASSDFTGDISNKLGDISDSSGKTAKNTEKGNEDLKYLRDLAEREHINQFTTAKINVELGGITNNVSSEMDLDGIIDYIATELEVAVESVAEGVHA